MTPYDIKNAAHHVALEGAVLSMRRGSVEKLNPSQLGKAYIDIYKVIFDLVEKFLLKNYGYEDKS